MAGAPDHRRAPRRVVAGRGRDLDCVARRSRSSRLRRARGPGVARPFRRRRAPRRIRRGHRSRRRAMLRRRAARTRPRRRRSDHRRRGRDLLRPLRGARPLSRRRPVPFPRPDVGDRDHVSASSSSATRTVPSFDAREIADALATARERTLGILDPVPARDQERQVSELMSPLCWDLAHLGHYEELWLVRTLAGAAPTDALYDDVYDAFKHPRRERVTLPILDAHGARAFVASVRERTLDVLAGTPANLDLLVDAFVYGMVVQHEHQHDETMLATLQLMEDFEHPAANARVIETDTRAEAPADVLVPGGVFTMGTSTDAWAYDNERPARDVELAPFRIDTTPVTNSAYAAFIADGGYGDERLWTAAGWRWREDIGLV